MPSVRCYQKDIHYGGMPMWCGCLARSLEAYSALMNEATELLLANIALAAKEGRAIDIHKAIGDMTLQVVGTTAFG